MSLSDRSELLADVARILAEQAGELAREGVPYVQVDSPTYTTFADPSWDAWFAEHGIDISTMVAVR